ncbi:unnamed protein product [Adineta ricciae]|uniref:Uncharacterized protein n=1 Tax=Adineta ricciae TaxID=249248 RepID=A0A815XGR4_ADIRI|nr:unnamed protein product [Adineta ricciae]CAF1557216.1 unnamed protein product [Adineta ricciae]
MNDLDFLYEMNNSYYELQRFFVKFQSKYLKLKYFVFLLIFLGVIFISLFTVLNYSHLTPKVPPKPPCRPFTAPDNRSFFEREYSQSNLPKQISNSSSQDLLRQLRSLRLVVLSCARNIEKQIDRYRNHIEPIVNLFHPSSSIHICESDSKDKTVKKLRQWSRVQLYSYRQLSKTWFGMSLEGGC